MLCYYAHNMPTYMGRIMTTTTIKKATNLTLSADVLAEAKQLGINVSQACDAFLRDLVRQENERRWAQQNAAFIEAYNQTVEAEGLPLEQWRSF